ncbi:hypothetical protein IMZ48_43120 [Candidatus Bathyarchaeota archaeon]|nr:hypothetical protein [Candidatus Bathyarchaeota archaeon]
MLARERFSFTSRPRECSPYFFRSGVEPDSTPWATGRLTRSIKRFTGKVWGHPVTLQLMRQLCVGIAEKHVREVSRPFNRFDDRSGDAERGVVWAWQTGHRPL